MPHDFPSQEWLQAFHQKLNSDPQYAQVARNWEGDLCLIIDPDETFDRQVVMYFDLWHGACRKVGYHRSPDEVQARFVINAPYSNWVRILEGELHPIQALATMKLKLRGNMAYIMRNVPTVLDFTRCARELYQQNN